MHRLTSGEIDIQVKLREEPGKMVARSAAHALSSSGPFGIGWVLTLSEFPARVIRRLVATLSKSVPGYEMGVEKHTLDLETAPSPALGE